MSPLKLELPHPVAGRLEVFDELKGLAIILVVAYHFGGAIGWNNVLHGDLGVDIFVILSGAGLAFGARYEGARAFLARRLIRIMPTYWIVLTLFCIGNAYILQLRNTPLDILVHFLGVQGYFGDAYGMAINDSFWFITLILSLYVLFCVCHPLMGSPDRLLLAGMAISVTVALAFFYTGQAGMFSHLGLRLPGFFIGLLIGQLLKAGRLEIGLGWPLVLSVLLLTYVPYTQGVIFYTAIVALALMGAYVFGWRAVAPLGLRTTVARRLRFLGRHSLEIFLIHQPLMRNYNTYLQARFLGKVQPSVGSIAFGMVIALVVTLYASVELRLLVRRFTPGNGSSR
jgi:peptidoglycan/LPS O-acetylase OafA/YrhL